MSTGSAARAGGRRERQAERDRRTRHRPLYPKPACHDREDRPDDAPDKECPAAIPSRLRELVSGATE